MGTNVTPKSVIGYVINGKDPTFYYDGRAYVRGG